MDNNTQISQLSQSHVNGNATPSTNEDAAEPSWGGEMSTGILATEGKWQR